jgi:hypothetical protein
MNISTGGPHILLFERDQQLTALITSEFQLAGYECHSARTAVEVFDALARYPIRIVLVDLAQAAAARREFWVALDTQRRGRGVHVLTFHCSNLAGYGPQDPDDRSRNAMADLEIDGMSGLIKLVDEVRTRVPGSGAVTNTLPRLPRVGTPQQPAQPTQQPVSAFPSTAVQQTGQMPPVTANPLIAATGTTYRTGAASDSSANPFNAGNANTPRNGSASYAQATTSTPAVPPAQNGASGVPVAAASNPPASSKTASYTDKIRAVLYPNQRNWSAQGNTPAPAQQETRPSYDAPEEAIPGVPENEFTALQRLANGQAETENSAESGLAQLSRLAHANYTNGTTAAPDLYQTNTDASYQLPDNIQTAGTPFPHSHSSMEQVSSTTGPMNYAAAVPQTPQVSPSPQVAPAPSASRPVQGNERISAQPLRASPIQDLPVERAGGTQASPENSRRPDVLSRTNYGQQQTAPVAIPPLASISTPPPAATSAQATGADPGTTSSASPTSSAPSAATAFQKAVDAPQVEQEEREEYFEEDPRETTAPYPAEQFNERADKPRTPDNMDQQPKKPVQEQNIPQREGMSTVHNNTTLFDIMQSLPPMPPVAPQPPQPVQPQVLSGRATRSLGSVLLAGHLVPQNRLEVAQNIQRMLRGVDLNYQLGEILLMFKLLTPDQLLAASLVSYGLITTTQISALGRIRQELHSIGLEYDLESLIILFRILTPEQLREVKNSWQG